MAKATYDYQILAFWATKADETPATALILARSSSLILPLRSHHVSKPAGMGDISGMGVFRHGHALWEPEPNHNYERIKLGDVGYIRRGGFHLLFSATRPLDSCQLGQDVPQSFEPLDVGPFTLRQPLSPGCITESVVEKSGVDVGASASATPSAEPAVSFSFELTKEQGAALVTKCHTFRADVECEADYEEYTKRHYNSWVTFSRKKRLGNDIKPVLVTGVDMTREFSMMAYSSNGASLSSKFTIPAPLIASASGSAWGKWETRGLIHTNCGPHLQNLPPLPEGLGPEIFKPNIEGGPQRPYPNTEETPEELNPKIVKIPEQFNQCVFVRYYTMRWRALWIPEVMKASAGPHDLGPGKNYDETLPELMVQSTSDSNTGFEGGGGSATDYYSLVPYDDSNLEPIHNEERDDFDVIAKYVFENSKAEAVLIHHRDIYQMREGTLTSEMSGILSERRPDIEVDGDGVGRLIGSHCRQDAVYHHSPSGDTSQSGLVHGDSPSNNAAEAVFDKVYERLIENIGSSTQTRPYSHETAIRDDGSLIPQRLYVQGTSIPNDGAPQKIYFATAGGRHLPAELALAGRCDLLVDRDSAVFTELGQTLNLRIEWPGYDGWGAQIRIVNYQEKPKSISRAKLVTDIAKLLHKFIEIKKSVSIDPAYEKFRVGPGGIELHHIGIASLDRVSRGSWQPTLVYNGLKLEEIGRNHLLGSLGKPHYHSEIAQSL
ncbi:hypothetical protein BJ322DRAFT_1171048 [Thelephora terrestris]|uniref:Uncharacterized protein n=1 Tax=Thelephora terrestris TaxID=56493 RepID=A0A9P6LAQ8_9AGAM|nr:hypothetical protein BJ322DRAFT_1171048 [Thelephora terrestris]